MTTITNILPTATVKTLANGHFVVRPAGDLADAKSALVEAGYCVAPHTHLTFYAAPLERTTLRAYRGWDVCHNPLAGKYWAENMRGIGIGPGEDTFADAVYFAKHGEPKIG